MTEKQLKILHSALELFSNDGVDATSTSKIAQRAGVSEGLIFRHFGNKDGLLNAILEHGGEKILGLFEEIARETDPSELIQKTIEMPFAVNASEYNIWRLIYTLKWLKRTHLEAIDQATTQVLTKAFSELNYENPELEAEEIFILIDGLATRILLNENYPNKDAIRDKLLSRYQLKNKK